MPLPVVANVKITSAHMSYPFVISRLASSAEWLRQLGDVRRYTSGFISASRSSAVQPDQQPVNVTKPGSPLDSLILPLSLHGKCLASASGEKSRRKNKQLHYPVTLT